MTTSRYQHCPPMPPMLSGAAPVSRRSAADATSDTAASSGLPASGGDGSTTRKGYILPFRRQAVRRSSQHDLEQAVAQAARLLRDGDIDSAERRFHSLATISRSWPHLRDQQAAWKFPAWVGVVLCHAVRHDWLLAEMAAREHLSQVDERDVAEVYLAAVALSNDWLEKAPRPDGAAPVASGSGPLRHRFPRNADAHDASPREPSDPARDYAYALVSAVRFRLGGEAS